MNKIIYPWYLINLHALRHHVEHNFNKLEVEHFSNKDGRSGGVAFSIASFPIDPPILVAFEEPAPYQATRRCVIPKCEQYVPIGRTDANLCDEHYVPVSDETIARQIARWLADQKKS
jgi:hypothetical protein